MSIRIFGLRSSVIQVIDIGYGYFGGIAVDDFDGVSGCELAFFEDGEVEPAGVAFDEALDHVVAIEADRDFVAGDAGLRDHQESGTDAELVTDVEGIFEQAFGCEILAESSPREVRFWELPAPVGIVLGGVGVDRLIGATMDGEVGLAVAAQIDTVQFDRALDGIFEDASGNLRSLPENDAGTSDVDRDNFHADKIRESVVRIRRSRIM